MPLPPTNSNVCASSNPESAGPAMAPIHRATILAQVGERRFPETFLWGVATAAPPHEGEDYLAGARPADHPPPLIGLPVLPPTTPTLGNPPPPPRAQHH